MRTHDNERRRGALHALSGSIFVVTMLVASSSVGVGRPVDAARPAIGRPTAEAGRPPVLLRLVQAGRPVTFTDAQAERGRAAYTASCQDCHGKNLDDGEFGGAPIRGSYFESKFGDAPASALFLYLSTAMPPDRPGQLSQATYADITAYLLQRNGYQAGGQELPSNVDMLDTLMLKK